MSQALWSPTNTSVYSSVFNVPPGKVCVLFAANMQENKDRADNSTFLSPQELCVRRLVHDFSIPEGLPICSCCDWIFDLSSIKEVAVADEVVQSGGCCWALTARNNLCVIGVPGAYRLELNDHSAVGRLQVYADLYDAKTFPPQVRGLFFE